jgi:hypothetical protein
VFSISGSLWLSNGAFQSLAGHSQVQQVGCPPSELVYRCTGFCLELSGFAVSATLPACADDQNAQQLQGVQLNCRQFYEQPTCIRNVAQNAWTAGTSAELQQ